MAVNPLLALFLFLLTFTTGFSAEISVFVKTGDSVQLDLQTFSQYNLLYWGKDKSTNIVTYISKIVVKDSSYKDRVDFNDETFSLTLKKMQKTDSGLYTARTSEESKENIVAYRVSVIDAVDAPVLTVNSNSSSDSCTVNFTCRAHDLMINSSYQNNRCSPEEVTSHENYTLILHCSEESIICNHSNPVSWKKDRIEIKQLCADNKETVSRHEHTNSLLIIVCMVVGVVLVLCIFVGVFSCRRHKKGVQEADNTVYAQVESQEMQKTNNDGHTYDVPERVQDQTQKETGDNRPNTTYCTVGQHQKPAVPVETIY